MSLFNTVKSIFQSFTDSNNPQQNNMSQSAQPTQFGQPESTYIRERTPEEWETYFRYILKTEFQQYDIYEKVAVTDLVGYAIDEFKLYKKRPTQAYKAEWGQPYTFVLSQAGMIKGVVMLGNGRSHDSNVKYLISRKYAQKMGVPYINFYTQMPNERDYVINRIHKFL